MYALDAAGQRLADLGQRSRPRRPRPVGTAYLDHALAVAEVYVRVVLADRSGALRLVRFAGEPGAWRSFYGAGGVVVTIAPDAYLVTSVDGFEDHWFLELDLGTESAATLARKLAVYRGYWQSGTEQAAREVFPKVLWLVPDESRVGVLAKVISRQPTEARALFAVALSEQAVARLRQGAA